MKVRYRQIPFHTTFGYFVLLLLAVVFLTPFYWMASTAFKSTEQTFALPPIWLPRPPHPENFAQVFREVPFARFILNSFVLVFWTTVGHLFSSLLVGYGFARLRFPGRTFLFFLLLSTLIIPYQITLIPRFILFSKLGWVNTYLPLIIPAFMGNPFLIFLVRQYMLSIPLEFDEAAIIDGASRLQILRYVILPLCKPVLVLVIVFTFVWTWNDFLGPLIYLNDPAKFPVSLGLYFFRGERETSWNLLMAASLVAMLPPLIVFFLAQRRLIGGIRSVEIRG